MRQIFNSRAGRVACRTALGVGVAAAVTGPGPAWADDLTIRPAIVGYNFVISPEPWNVTPILLLNLPINRTPWTIQTEYAPSSGYGMLSAAYGLAWGPLTVAPSLGVRMRNMAIEGKPFLISPQLLLTASLGLLPHLDLVAHVLSGPTMYNPANGSIGSDLNGYLYLATEFQRIGVQVGYIGGFSDPTRPGLGALSGTVWHGPSLVLYTKF